MRILFKNLNLIPFISILLLNLSLQSQTIWNCVEESTGPTTCTNQDNEEIVMYTDSKNFSLKIQ